jgi:hypothetical protein
MNRPCRGLGILTVPFAQDHLLDVLLDVLDVLLLFLLLFVDHYNLFLERILTVNHNWNLLRFADCQVPPQPPPHFEDPSVQVCDVGLNELDMYVDLHEFHQWILVRVPLPFFWMEPVQLLANCHPSLRTENKQCKLESDDFYKNE